MTQIFQHGHALIVGIGADLPNTVDDAEGLANILRDPARCAYPPQQVHTLTGENATRQAVLETLDQLAAATTPQSTVVVYYSGHGYRVSHAVVGSTYYLLPYGYDINRLAETALHGDTFAQKLAAIPAQKLLILLDCCHAGGVGAAKAPAGLDFAKAPLPPEALPLLAEGRGRVLIASSKEDELSYAGRPYSAFTLALIESLCGVGVAKKDGYTRISDLALHAREMVPGRTKNRQHPVLHFEHADNFAVAHYAGGDAQPKGLPFKTEPEIEPEPGAWRSVPAMQVGDIRDVKDSEINIAGRDIHKTEIRTGGGAYIGGGVHTGGGDFVGGDKTTTAGQGGIAIGGNVSGSTLVTGDHNVIGSHVSSRAEYIQQIYTAIGNRPDTSPYEKDDLKEKVKDIEKEDAKGEQADPGFIEHRLRNIRRMAPDIADVILAALVNPAAGFGMVAKKVAEKIKATG